MLSGVALLTSGGGFPVDKGPDAFRTISEVASDLDLPQHVLRFWETRFTQIKPLKRGGGRRYYRPDDIELLQGIRHLLYGEGYTIKGVQRILKDQGVRHVMSCYPGSPTADDIETDQSLASPSQVLPEVASGQALPPAAMQAEQVAAVPVPGQMADDVAAAALQTAHDGAIPEDGVSVLPQDVPLPHEGAPRESIPTEPDPAAPAYGGPLQPVSPVQSRAFTPPPEPKADPFAPAYGQVGVAQPVLPSKLADLQPDDLPAPPAGIVADDQPQGYEQRVATVAQQQAALQAQQLHEQRASRSPFRIMERLRGETEGQGERAPTGLPKDDVRRLQATLFELLECKRLLDQARS